MNTQTNARRKGLNVHDVINTFGDSLPILLVIVAGMTVTLGLFSLAVADVVLGVMGVSPLTSEAWQSVLLSLMGTGFNLAIIGLAIKCFQEKRWWFFALLLAPALVINGVDIYFDALSADYIAYGQYVDLVALPAMERTHLVLLRVMLGLASTLGDFCMAYALVAFQSLRRHLVEMLSGLA